MNQEPVDILSLPDDQAMEAIAQGTASSQVQEEAAPAPTPTADEQVGDVAADEGNDTGEAGGGKPEGEDDGAAAEQNEDAKPDATKPDAVASDKVDADGKPVVDEKPAADAKPEEGKTDVVQPDAPKALASYTADDKVKAFDQLMAPFKANNKTIELRDPAEAVKLMQMGANYTRNMQKLRSKERTLTMLENNGLLDDSKLAYAIDLIAGKPEAIQRLLADSQFDPLTADKDQAAAYVPGDHQVSDVELAFNRAIDDVIETATGGDLITEVKNQWDQESKKWLFQHPDVLRDLNLQRESGIYQQITQEMDRLSTLGQIPAGTPFLQAYNGVGEMLHKSGQLKGKAPAANQEQPVEERVATPAKAVSNDEKARAAAPTKSAPAAAVKDDSGVLGLSDDDFLKQMEGRV